jgi:hypothetical protein
LGFAENIADIPRNLRTQRVMVTRELVALLAVINVSEEAVQYAPQPHR